LAGLSENEIVDQAFNQNGHDSSRLVKSLY